MYLDFSTIKKGGKSYTRVLLRESYREDGKVKKRTVANLSGYPDKDIQAIKLALQYKNDLSLLGGSKDINLSCGSSIGAVWLLHQVAGRLGITQALGNSQEGRLALWQVMARIIDQGSRLSAVRLATTHSACDVLGLDEFNEDTLYRNLDWIAENQSAVEDALQEKNVGRSSELFLYDVTSSYLEGTENELAAFGCNRDGKKGKRQIVIGLLCNVNGDPVSVEFFNGNTKDTETFIPQVEKVMRRFGGKSVTFVGDKGMIKGPQIEKLEKFEKIDVHYLISITKPQIEKLLKENIIQIGLFDQNLAEITADDGVRYILQRNPVRAEEMAKSREDKHRVLSKMVEVQNQYLKEHQRAKPEVALGKVTAKASTLKLNGWTTVTLEDKRSISVSVDKDARSEATKLDGCYVLKTDLLEEIASKETVRDRYKDLAKVEWAFSMSKTDFLELRPIYVRLDSRIRAHVFVVMLAYKMIKELSSLWRWIDVEVKEGIAELSSLCAMEVSIKDGGIFNKIPKPRELSLELLKAADVRLPTVLPSKGMKITAGKN